MTIQIKTELNISAPNFAKILSDISNLVDNQMDIHIAIEKVLKGFDKYVLNNENPSYIVKILNEVTKKWFIWLKTTSTLNSRYAKFQPSADFLFIKSLEKYNEFINRNTFIYGEKFLNNKYNLCDEELINKTFYNNTDPILKDFVLDIKSRLDFYINGYDGFFDIYNFSHDNLNLYDDNKVRSKIIKLNNLIKLKKTPLEEKILSRLICLTPTEFEHFSLHFIARIKSLNYEDVQRMIKHSGKIGDDGIDGVVTIKDSNNTLTKYYIQCKRYTKSAVGQPDVQKFSGAMEKFGAEYGIFLTSSYFSKASYQYVYNLSSKNIDLIGGKQIIADMINYKIGIREIIRDVSHEIDEDFFNQFLDNKQIRLID